MVDSETQTDVPEVSWLDYFSEKVSAGIRYFEADEPTITPERGTQQEQGAHCSVSLQQQQLPPQQEKRETRFQKLKKLFTPEKKPPIPQNSFVDFEETEEEITVIYRQAVARHSNEPHPVRFQNPKYIICGVACSPKDEKTASPEINVLDGGVGYDYVELLLNPLVNGYWACAVEILGRSKQNKKITIEAN